MKAKGLNTLHSTKQVYSLPIEIYYFSCNLDHVLYSIRNLEEGLKIRNAEVFADEYENREADFIAFISNKSLCLAYNDTETWAKIKQEYNSLLRYTNLIVFFFNNFELLKDEIKEVVEKCCAGETEFRGMVDDIN